MTCAPFGGLAGMLRSMSATELASAVSPMLRATLLSRMSVAARKLTWRRWSRVAGIASAVVFFSAITARADAGARNEEHQRIRAAVAECLDPRLRLALETVADETLDEALLAQLERRELRRRTEEGAE